VTLEATPAGGTWSGAGVDGDAFDPAVAGAGTHTLTYSYTDGNGCSNSATIDVTLNPLPVVTATDPGPLCSNAAPVELAGTPGNGTWTGTGVTGTGPYSFDPSVGTQTLTYTFTDANGCTNSDDVEVSVETAPSATIAYPGSPYISGAGTAVPSFSGTTGGTWTAAPAGLDIDPVTGEVDLGTSLPGSYTVTYTIAATAVCDEFSTDAPFVIRAVYYSQQSGAVSDPIWDLVTVGTPGPATFTPYITMVVQAGHVVNSTDDLSVDDLVVAGSLTLEENTTLTVHGDQVQLNGSVNALPNSELELVGDEVTIAGLSAQTLWDLRVNTPSGTTLNALLGIQGTLQLEDGATFHAGNGRLTLLSNLEGTGRLGPVPATATFTGDLTMQRYIPAGATNWRLLGSPVEGATVLNWKDDFITAGFPGSHYPNFDSPVNSGVLWPSIRKHTEPVLQGSNLPQVGSTVSGTDEPLDPGMGFGVWCGDQLTGTAAFVVDVTGAPRIATTPIELPVSYTDRGAPELDGWNLVSNPLPSPIAFSAIERDQVTNEYWIYNPATGNMAHWNGTTGTSTPAGVLDGVIASSQGFWLKATGPGASATVDESAKVAEGSGVFGGDGVADLPTVRLDIHGSANSFSDQTVIHFGAGTPAQEMFDVLKVGFAHQQAPSIATVASGGEMLMVNDHGAYSTDIAIPVAVRARVNGTYTVTAHLANTGLSCLWLEDLVTGAVTPLTDGAQYTFTQPTSNDLQERFLLHATAPLAFTAEDGLCGPASGQAMVEVGEGAHDVTWTTATGTVLLEQSGVSGAASFDNLSAGNYTVRVAAPGTVCGELVHDFSIATEGVEVDVTIVAPASVVVDEQVLFTAAGTEGVSYLWHFGDGTTSAEASPVHSFTAPGEYVVSLTATLGECSVTTTTFVVVTFSTGVNDLSEVEARVWGGRGTIIVEHGYEGGLLGIDVMDASGRHWYAKTHAAVPGRITIPADDLATGVWFVRLTHEGRQQTFRVPLVR